MTTSGDTPMIRFFTVLLSCLFLFPSLVVAKNCGSYACLESKQMPEDYYKLEFKSYSEETLLCYARYENSRILRRVQNVSDPFYLRGEYSTAAVSWRCDPENSCPMWMGMGGFCKK